MKSPKQKIVNCVKALAQNGLNRGASGNVSVRIVADEILITPSGVAAENINESNLVEINLLGEVLNSSKSIKTLMSVDYKPSSEWRIHCAIYQKHKNINAVIHTHSTYAVALSTLRVDLPAFNYMIALAGGDNVRCAEYAVFGSKKLSDAVLVSLKDRKACLMANHGLIAIGESLEEAQKVAEEVEELCRQYLICHQIAKPKILSSKQMKLVIKKFKNYGLDYKKNKDE